MSQLQLNPKIQLEVRSAAIASGAGLLALRELDDALSLTDAAGGCLQGVLYRPDGIGAGEVRLLRGPAGSASALG